MARGLQSYPQRPLKGERWYIKAGKKAGINRRAEKGNLYKSVLFHSLYRLGWNAVDRIQPRLGRWRRRQKDGLRAVGEADAHRLQPCLDALQGLRAHIELLAGAVRNLQRKIFTPGSMR